MHVLIVEDDAKIAEFVARGFREAGFRTTRAADGEDGLLQAQHVAHQPVHQVPVARLQLPVGLHVLRFLGVVSVGVGQAVELIKADAEHTAELRDQRHVGAAAPLLPVADGVRSDAEFPGEKLLVDFTQFSVIAHPLADGGQGGFLSALGACDADHLICFLFHFPSAHD